MAVSPYPYEIADVCPGSRAANPLPGGAWAYPALRLPAGLSRPRRPTLPGDAAAGPRILDPDPGLPARTALHPPLP